MYKKDKLRYEEIENGIIIPPPIDETGKILFSVNDTKLCGVYSSNFKYVDISARFAMCNEPSQDYNNKIKQLINIEYVDEKIIYIGIIGGQFMAYGNLILDAISRLWIFLEDERYKDFKIVYFSDGNDDIVFTLLELFGLKTNNLIRCIKPLRAKCIIVPEESFNLWGLYHVKFNSIINKIKSEIPAKKFKKLYFSRSKLVGDSKAYGEEYIEKVFKNAGYKIIYPEKISISEQISYLKGAQYFAGVDGSAMHNAIFLNDNAECIYLQRSEHKNSVQYIIDEMKSLKSHYIKANCKTFRLYYYANPYLIGLTKDLKRFFDKNNFKYSIFEYQKYLKNNLLEYINTLSSSMAVRDNLAGYYTKEELEIFSNLKNLLKYMKQYRLNFYKRNIYKFKLFYYLKQHKYKQIKKYYKLLYK